MRRWLKQPGDSYLADEVLALLESEESSLELKAQASGKLLKHTVRVGQTVAPSDTLAQIESADAAPATSAPSKSASPKPSESKVSDAPASVDTSEVVPILMPQAGNSMEEGTVLEWRVKEGDSIELGQILCEIETDKATMEYESPAAGRLARIVAALNEPILVKELIAVFAPDDASADAYLAGQAGETATASPSAASPATAATPAAVTSTVATPVSRTGDRVAASPAARRLASAQGIALESIANGSGPGGRILSGDLAGASKAAPVAVASGDALRKPMTKMRRAIATNLQRSKQTVPHFYLRATIDAAAMLEVYAEQKEQTNCSLNDLVVLAVGRAMRDFPAVRSQVDGDEIVEFPHANIGIAVGVDDGLIVPVVLGVDRRSLAELAAESKRVVTAARNGSLENIGKGNFTISNMGMFGVDEFSAIINPPESGILAVGGIRETVVVHDGAMRIGKVMTMTLSADHRVVDGVMAAKFMNRLQEILENAGEELS